MCTVTFIPVNNTIFLTHNRDEKTVRSRAIPPRAYKVNGYRLIFPKDKTAGGSWFAVNEFGNAAVLLNGGFVKHVPMPPYRKSRGLAFLDVVASEDLLQTYEATDLHNIEPFTVILWNNHRLVECRWDGSEKHITSLDPHQSHIWSSATLYDDTIISKRKEWFLQWLTNHPYPSGNDIIDFHRFAGDGDRSNDLLMNRNELIRTVSISAMEINNRSGKGLMKYFDLQDDNRDEQEIKFIKAGVEK